jgi:HSP20 family protein
VTIERWEPFRQLQSLRETMNRVFDDVLVRPRDEWYASFRDMLATDVYENNSSVVVEVALPGVTADAVEVTTSGHMLTIKGQRQANDEIRQEDYYRREQRYGAFIQTLTLPDTADVKQPAATFKDGVLKVTFPKLAAAEVKHVEVKA